MAQVVQQFLVVDSADQPLGAGEAVRTERGRDRAAVEQTGQDLVDPLGDLLAGHLGTGRLHRERQRLGLLGYHHMQRHDRSLITRGPMTRKPERS
ncbi:hypothetical protein SAVIM40S_02936 [Streptomyces avidinii]